MGFSEARSGDAVSEVTKGVPQGEEAAEDLEIVVQLRRGVEISSFTTFPLHFPFFSSFLLCWFSLFFRLPRFSVFPSSLLVYAFCWSFCVCLGSVCCVVVWRAAQCDVSSVCVFVCLCRWFRPLSVCGVDVCVGIGAWVGASSCCLFIARHGQGTRQGKGAFCSFQE